MDIFPALQEQVIPDHVLGPYDAAHNAQWNIEDQDAFFGDKLIVEAEGTLPVVNKNWALASGNNDLIGRHPWFRNNVPGHRDPFECIWCEQARKHLDWRGWKYRYSWNYLRARDGKEVFRPLGRINPYEWRFARDGRQPPNRYASLERRCKARRYKKFLFDRIFREFRASKEYRRWPDKPVDRDIYPRGLNLTEVDYKDMRVLGLEYEL